MNKLSIIILGKNVEAEVVPAFKTSRFADEVIYVDTHTGSTDKTLDLAKKYADKIVKSPPYNFSKWRNDGAKEATGDWLLYLDSDERITVELAREIRSVMDKGQYSAYEISRYEIFLGKHLNHWGDPWILRLFKKEAFIRYEGALHEQPKVKGKIGRLSNQLVHLSHKNIDEKVTSTLAWSKLEANLLFESGHPQMKGWRFFRIMFTEFFNRFFRKGLWRDGTEGVIESIYQMFSVFITYERLWEMQRKPSLKETYQNIDKKILEQIRND